MPWFMTVFGRDTLITSLQTMLLGPELATASLDALAALQARDDDPSLDAEPGKIVHELRRGRAVETWFRAYDGTSTRPRCTSSSCLRSGAGQGTRFAGRLREPALEALDWIDSTATATETASSSTCGGRRGGSKTSRGRTRATRSASPTARSRSPDRARGGAGLRLDAKLRLAELARTVWGTTSSQPASRARRPSCGAASTSVLGRGARRLLRARAGRGQAAGRLALLEPRPPALERDRHDERVEAVASGS